MNLCRFICGNIISLGVFQVLCRFSAEMCSSLGFGPVFDGSPFSLKSGVWSGSRRRFFFSRGFGNSGRWRFTSRLGFGLAHKDDLLASVAMPGSGWCNPPSTSPGEGGRHSHPPKRVEFEVAAKR